MLVNCTNKFLTHFFIFIIVGLHERLTIRQLKNLNKYKLKNIAYHYIDQYIQIAQTKH